MTDMAAKLRGVRHVEVVDGLVELQPYQRIIGPRAKGAFEVPPLDNRLHIIVRTSISGKC
jgi:hypothetical protein